MEVIRKIRKEIVPKHESESRRHVNRQLGHKAHEAFKESSNEQEPDSWKEYVDTLSDEDILNENYDESKLTRTADDFHLDYRNYPFLRRHTEHAPSKDGIIDIPKNIDYIGYTYTRYTGDIINQICGRYSVESNLQASKLSRKKVKMPADHVIYLDKSGRPVSYLVNTFWDEFAPKDENGQPMKRPPHSFANLDRISILDNLFGLSGINETNAWSNWEENKHKLNDFHFAQLRSLFLKEPLDPESPPTPEEIMKMPTILDGKNVLIVDEVEFGGLSMRMAECLLKGAIPEARFAGTTFWQDATVPLPDNNNNTEDDDGGINPHKKVGRDFLAALPVWYHSDKAHFQGRGVGDVNKTVFEKLYDDVDRDADAIIARSGRQLSEEEKRAIRKRLKAKRFTELYGAAFRGVRTNLGPGGEDNGETRQLTKDIKQLLVDYRAHKIFPWMNPKNINHEDEAEHDYVIQCVRAGVSPNKCKEMQIEIDRRTPDKY